MSQKYSITNTSLLSPSSPTEKSIVAFNIGISICLITNFVTTVF